MNILERRIFEAVALVSLGEACLVGVRMVLTGTVHFWYLLTNLCLAWISPLVAVWLIRELKIRRWLSWQNLLLTFLWLVFLPNTWYVLTDFIHVVPSGEISQLYDIVLVSLLTICGFVLGFTSLYLIHRQILKRWDELKSYLLIEFVILLSSFAIYVGRDLRWNSWDVIANPGGVFLNVSNQIIDPFGSSRALNVTALFFVLISLLYVAVWLAVRPLEHTRR
ncbi:MAG TPA: DUF1361 domain-containing protein [Candidatus Saccharimonadales bacterium]|nr:DUF1361 domain-containing protein [Candidatus Saccharimonadales bacterium]